MATLYITEQGAKIKKEGRRIIVEKDNKKLLDLPIIKTENILIYGNVQVSTQAMNMLLSNGISLSFLYMDGRIKGKLLPVKAKNVILRMNQYEKTKHPDFVNNISRIIVKNKLKNCIKLIEDYRKNYWDKFFSESIEKIKNLFPIFERKTKPNTILGIEGRGSVIYFDAYSKMFRSNLTFGGRNRKPPRDPVNALLSFGYMLVLNEIFSLLEAVGFDPYLGFLHKIDYGRPSLALDLLEEFRVPIVDKFVLNLSNKNILKASDFTKREDGGIYLKPESLKKFFIHYDRWMNKQRKHGSFKNIIKNQVYRFQKTISDKKMYVPYSD